MEIEYQNNSSDCENNKKLYKYLMFSKTIFPPSVEMDVKNSAFESLSYIFEKYKDDAENTHVLIVGSLYLVGSFLRILTE